MENVVPIVHQGLEAIAWPLDAGTDRALTKEPQEFRISGMVAHLKHAGIVFAVSTMRFKKRTVSKPIIYFHHFAAVYESIYIFINLIIYIHLHT